ncbi:carbohydrate-binding module family 18 protein [Karstenula rhodostoma CBS 690.94]|uniref:Carbohydrate-binding module family 18 protein n=1 Tax=Karstenula rhodostoma CBS 690.94 TaxID=1392251 RepID=A0A9P4PNN6_9PLEO|nr:carbohydrate-binding module family 18 protein [Karstenula rhodostoma CBS 690.94]
MRASALALLSLATVAVAQNCGPKYNNAVCAAGKCCSQYGWCNTSAAHCDPTTCLKSFSGKGSPCAASPTTTTTTLKTKTSSTAKPPSPYASTIPIIDICGHAQGGISCPGAGPSGYFYRCCSSAGHCGPKNNIQDQELYCGAGCQGGFGKCDSVAKPAMLTGRPGRPGTAVGEGETCGPIVGRRCKRGLCCSGSNFCGRGEAFCGAGNWCQRGWGRCA